MARCVVYLSAATAESDLGRTQERPGLIIGEPDGSPSTRLRQVDDSERHRSAAPQSAATLRFTTFNQRTTPEVHGRVTLIGGDQTADEKTGRPYFKLQVRPDESELARLGNVKLVAGMPVEAFVQIMRAFREK